MTGACDDLQSSLGQNLNESLRNNACWQRGVLAAHDQRRDVKCRVRLSWCRIVYEGLEVQWRLGGPACESVLPRRPHSLPGAVTIPIIDKIGNARAIVARGNAMTDAPGDPLDFG